MGQAIREKDSRLSQELENRPRANFQVLFDPGKMGWLHAALLNQPEVALYSGKFMEPFDNLKVAVMRRQNQVVATALLDIDPHYTENFGQSSIGNVQMLESMGKRYKEHDISGANQQLVVAKNGKTNGIITRLNNHQIIVQMGGEAGSIELSQASPVNDLTLGINQFTLLLQRYVNYTWQSLPELSDRQMRLAFELPQMPEGAPESYFSTPEIILKEFRAHHREVDLEQDIGGFRRVKDSIKALMLDLTDPDQARAFGTQPFSNRFLLLFGDEGTGKSLFVKALDTKVRQAYGNAYEHFRLSMTDIIQNYGAFSHNVVNTVLNHIIENEKAGIATILHVDCLDSLCAPDNPTEYMHFRQVVVPIITALREFGQELSPASYHVLVIGESRAPRQVLPESIQRTFRRTLALQPERGDLVDALRVQIATARKFAERIEIDPFDSGVDANVDTIIQEQGGLTGLDMQHAILNITSRNKASGKKPDDVKITAADIGNEIIAIQASKGLTGNKGELGFRTSNFQRKP